MVSDILVNIGSVNGVASNKRQAITSTNTALVSVSYSGIKFRDILTRILTFVYRVGKCHLLNCSHLFRPKGVELSLAKP